MDNSSIQISVVGLDDKIFSFNTPPDDLSPEGLGQLGLKLAIQVSFDVDEEIITIRLDIRTFYHKSVPDLPDKEIRLIRYVGEMHFRVRGAKTHFTDPNEEGEFLLPRDLVASLLATTFSTFRGVVYAKLGGNEMRTMLFPLMEVDQALKGESEFIRPERV